jgi:glycosyltransferase involved in cell wall biosynthesis
LQTSPLTTWVWCRAGPFILAAVVVKGLSDEIIGCVCFRRRGLPHGVVSSMVTLVVITRDEEDRIAACLSSVPWVAESIVVDSGSTDATVEVARQAGARVVQTDWPGHVAQKNRALALATQPWILSLDADEALSPEASEALREALQDPGPAEGFSFPRCSTWLGRPIRHGRWYPDRKLRAVRRGAGLWVGDDPHDRLTVSGPVHKLTGDILHVPYRDFGEHLRTIDAYTRIHADTMAKRGQRAHWWDPTLRPPLHFINAYLLKRGFLDGPSGMALAGLGAAYVALKWSRLYFHRGAD